MRSAALAAALSAALAGAAVAGPGTAAGTGAGAGERMPAPSVVRAIPGTAGVARAIVRFKADATPVREQALSAQATPGEARSAVAYRAHVLGQRRGMTLAPGAALDARTQVVVASGGTSQALAAALAADPEVEYAVPDQPRRRLAVPNDPYYAAGPAAGPAAGQWYLRAPEADVRSSIDAPAAWDVTAGDPGVVVAILDTGVRFDHEDLVGRLLPGYDMVTDDAVANDGQPGRDADASDPGDWVSSTEAGAPPFQGCSPEPSSWHGTQLAGLIGAAANNAIGMAGVAHGVRLLPVRVLGKCQGFDSDIIAGMRWAAGLPVPGVPANPTPARVLNLSLGGAGTCSAAYRSVIADVGAVGAVVVAAAGNSTGQAVSMPANCPGALGVVGLRHVGTKVGFSDLGPEIALAAPGGNCVNLGGPCLYPLLTSTNPGATAAVEGASSYTDGFNISVGTSFAAPLVAGTAALVLSVRPQLRPAEVRELLRATSRPFPDPALSPDASVPLCRAPGGADQLECHCTTSTCGAGMLDAGAAVVAASTAQPSVPDPEPLPSPPPEVPAASGGGGAGAAWWLLPGLGALILQRRRQGSQWGSPTPR